MKIGHKLVLLVALPLVGISFLGWRAFSESSQMTSEMRDLESLTQIASQVSTLVHETQKERGMTAGFLGSNGTKFGTELAGQRKASDQQYDALLGVLAGIDLSRFDPAFAATLTGATDQFTKLSKVRSGVDAQTITTAAAISAYTRMNADFLDSVAYMSKLSSDGAMSVKLVAYVSFLKGKERAGIERAVLSNVFATDAFGEGLYTRFVGLVTEQDTYFREFEGIADAPLVAALVEAQKSDASKQVAKFRLIAHSKSVEGGFDQDASDWFAAATARIGGLREVEQTLSDDILATASAKRSSAAAARTYMGSLVGLLVVVVVALSVFIAKQITSPIKALTSRIRDIAEGDGDLTLRVDADRNDEIGELGTWFNTFVEKIHGIITDVANSTREVASAATEIAASAEEMAAGIANQQDQTTQVSAAVEEMSATVGEVSAKSKEAAQAAQKSGAEATEGGMVVTETVDEMGGISQQVNIAATAVSELGKKGEQIGEIISVINDIADQTNLLALNAAIEAARAGEHGRGFAVVADEVRKLAERTTDATEEVGRSIREIQHETHTAVEQIQAGTERVGKGVELASRAGEALARIVESSQNVQGMVQSIAAASEQQSTASTQIARNIEQIDSITRESLQGAQQSAMAAAQLSTQAEGLQKIVGQFKV